MQSCSWELKYFYQNETQNSRKAKKNKLKLKTFKKVIIYGVRGEGEKVWTSFLCGLFASV
jgi:hypothetical protein